MSWENFMVDLIMTLIPVLASTVVYVLVNIGRFVIRSTDNMLAKAALENLEKVILATVSSLSQTIVDDLKQNRCDGKLSDEEASLVKNKALLSIREQTNSNQMNILEKQFGSVEEFIDNMLEQKVMETKLKKGDFNNKP